VLTAAEVATTSGLAGIVDSAGWLGCICWPRGASKLVLRSKAGGLAHSKGQGFQKQIERLSGEWAHA
jgi:hypothetical protein